MVNAPKKVITQGIMIGIITSFENSILGTSSSTIAGRET